MCSQRGLGPKLRTVVIVKMSEIQSKETLFAWYEKYQFILPKQEYIDHLYPKKNELIDLKF